MILMYPDKRMNEWKTDRSGRDSAPAGYAREDAPEWTNASNGK